jgi:hypothetical protein
MAISCDHGVAALIFFESAKRLRVFLQSLRTNFAKKIQVIDGQSSKCDARGMAACDVMMTASILSSKLMSSLPTAEPTGRLRAIASLHQF